MNNIQMFLVSESERHAYCLLLKFMHIGRKQSWIPDSRAAWGAVYNSLSGLTELCAEYWTLYVFYGCIIYSWSIVFCVGILPKHCDKDGWILFRKYSCSVPNTQKSDSWDYSYARISCTVAFWMTCLKTCFVVAVVVVVFNFLFPWFIWYETSNFCLLLHTSKSFSFVFFFLPHNLMTVIMSMHLYCMENNNFDILIISLFCVGKKVKWFSGNA